MNTDYLVVEGFGDFTRTLETCELVKVVTQFSSEAEAVKYSETYYEEQMWGEDAEGFSFSEDMRMTYFVLVRSAEEFGVLNEYGLAWLDRDPFTLSLWRWRDEGHSIYQGEECKVTGDVETCTLCALVAKNLG